MPTASQSRAYWDRLLRPILDAVGDSRSRPCLTGLHGGTTGFALTLLADQAPNKSWLIVTGSDEAAERLYEDLQFFHAMLGLSPEALALFPEWETLPYEATPPHVELIARRMQTLHRLVSMRGARLPVVSASATGDGPSPAHMEQARIVLVTSVPALIQLLLPPSVLSDACLRIRPGETLERATLVSGLLRLGYRQGSAVEIPGEFSVRGGIVDIYSTAYPDPLRVEFLGDTIESVRVFDTTTQKSTTTLTQAWLLPARELIYPADHPAALTPLPPDPEWLGREVYQSPETLLCHVPEMPVPVLEQPEALAKKATEFQKEVEEAYHRHGGTAEAAYPTPDQLYVPWETILNATRSWPCLAMEPVASLDDSWQPVVTFPSQSPNSVGLAQRGTPFSDTLAILDRLRVAGPALIVARSRGQVDRLLALFGEHDLPAAGWKPQHGISSSKDKPPFYLLQGDLSAGFVSAEGRLTIVTEEELFAKGMRHRPATKSKTATFLSSLEDLNVGDHVVHVQHGIGRYQGLRRLSVQGFESDYLILEFAGGDKLYVPLDRLNQVQRYRGAEGEVVRMDRLGGTSWARTTARVKQGIEEMAQELVELYANREVIHRTEYGMDSTLTHEFEAAFEYEETPDQLHAVEDIKRDMESPKPMDRLVCGDVGYGKTEVAMRAAFKAVEDNRQVAVLVPTTLLAQQHYENFAQRFAPFPARVAMLSRFQTAKEIRAVVRDLAAGTVDVVIGTHRLLQKDVEFRNLGLVIIDEEQWFGVRHKERLKQLRTQVDVLTLTATPIPRTLQMAMSGVRDLSVIDTPPTGRLAIRSQVLRFNETVIREAIVREMGRGGQTFFVHNRVQTMERMAAWLQELVPQARVVMAHGQMDERLLGSVIAKFLQRET